MKKSVSNAFMDVSIVNTVSVICKQITGFEVVHSVLSDHVLNELLNVASQAYSALTSMITVSSCGVKLQ